MPETDAEETARLRREADAYDHAMTRLPLDPPTGDPDAERVYWRARFEQLDELVRADLGYVPRKITFRERMTDGSSLRLLRERTASSRGPALPTHRSHRPT